MKQWVDCKVSKGMFSDEICITITDSKGHEISTFVPTSEVRPPAVMANVIKEGVIKLPDEHGTIVTTKEMDSREVING